MSDGESATNGGPAINIGPTNDTGPATNTGPVSDGGPQAEDEPIPSLPTRVGHASWGDNEFFGFRVLGDLAGRDSYWSAVSLSLGHRRLSEQEAGVLDDLTICCLAGDPRIYPLKAMRVGSAYGSCTMGVCAGYLAFDQGQLGPTTMGRASRLLVELSEQVGDPPDPARLTATLDGWLAQGRRLPGFGVVFRDRDERIDALLRCMRARGRTGQRYWRLMEAADAHGERAHRLPANIGLASSAVTLDLGFMPEQIEQLYLAFLVPCFLANAFEGAQQAPAVLQRLPDAAVEYVGTPARPSPREAARRAPGTTSPAGAAPEPPSR